MNEQDGTEEERGLLQDLVKLLGNLPSMTRSTKDIQTMVVVGFDVDDDNSPAPENIPCDSNDSPALILVDEDKACMN